LPWIFFQALGLPLSLPNVAGTAAALLILLQGVAYWHLKRVQISTAAAFLPWAPVFYHLKYINWMALGVASSTIIASDVFTTALGRDTLPGLAFLFLAVAEQINYFYVQLMYDNRNDLKWLANKGLKKSHLAGDLRRWCQKKRSGKRQYQGT
jgi:hypothetical protein